MVLRVLYSILLVTGMGILLLSLTKFRELGRFALIGVAMILTQATLLSGQLGSPTGSIVFSVGALAGLIGSIRLIVALRRT